MKRVKKWKRLLALLCTGALLLGNSSLSMAEDIVPSAGDARTEDTDQTEPPAQDDSAPAGGGQEDGADAGTGDGTLQGFGSGTEGNGTLPDVSNPGGTEGEIVEDSVSVTPADAAAGQNLSLVYSTHVRDIGWQQEVKDGAMAGTTGRNLSVEALKIQVSGAGESGSVEYKAHVRDIGWQDWMKDGAVAGTTGRALCIEALQIRLTGELAEKYDVYYRVHAQNFGWLGWAKNEEIAGTTGWAYHVEALEARLVSKGGPAPGSTADHYKPALWNVAFQQVEDSTTVEIRPESLEQIIGQSAATELSVTARLEYDGKTTRSVTAKKSIAKIKSEGFQVDFKTYGKFKVDLQFEKNGRTVRSVTQTTGVTAEEYNIAPLSATFPVVLFSLSAWDINTNAAGKKVPTFVMLDRPSAYNWDKLPEGVYGMPYLSESAIKSSASYTACKQYVKDLYEISPNAKFNLYINDITCTLIQDIIYANKIPQGQYGIYLLSDGSASYSIFNEAYAGANPEQTHQELMALWNDAKQYAYQTGTVKEGWGWHEHWDTIYAILSCEPGAQWWVGRNNLFTSGDNNAFAEKAKAAVTTKSIGSMLTELQAKGDGVVGQFKAWYDFNDGYFDEAVKQGKKAMLLLGTYVHSEANFEDYAHLTEIFYGDEYLYYYKGHPNTPTGLWPVKQEQLARLEMTDVDSSIAAELILFFNPEICLSGYGTTTFNSASAEMACGLFNNTKENALAAGNSVDYTGIDWFASPIDKNNVDAEIAALCSGDDTYYLLQFSDEILKEGKYDLAIFNATRNILDFYQKADGAYQRVERRDDGRKISYKAHVRDIGWQTAVSEGKTAGTVGRALSIEAFTVDLGGSLPYDGSVKYRAHVSNIGWQDWKEAGKIAGTEGRALPVEAVAMELTGELKEHYDIYYRTHVSEVGWLDWAKNGQNAGSAGYAYAMEAMQICLVEKGKSAPGSTETPFKSSLVQYQAHVEDYGWRNWVKEGMLAGTTGEAKRVEGIKIALRDQEYKGGIQYKTHVEDYGWQDWVSDGASSGTTGKAKRLEAIQIRLTGEMAEKYDVYYRTHIENFGWLDWAKNGESAGSEGYAYRMEGVQIEIVPKDGAAPGKTATPFRKRVR